MPSPAEAFASAQDAALRGSSALAAAMAPTLRLYNEIPANAPPPYVSIGERQILLENHDCAAEAEIFATVQWWSRNAPLDKGAQARAMGAAIISALNVELTVTGWDVDEFELQSEDYSVGADQSTHGRAVFHYLLTEQVT